MLRRFNLLDILGNLINPATYDAQVDGSQSSKIITVDQNGELVVAKSRDGRIDGDQYFDDIARGLIPGSVVIGAYGYFESGGAVSNNVVQPALVGQEINVAPIGGVQMEIISTSAQDSATGTGIRSVHVHYIDGDGNDADVDVTLDGQNPVVIPGLIRFVQCLHMNEFGAGKSAAGDITVKAGGDIYSGIPLGRIRCASSARMVPNGKRLLVKNISAGSVSGTSARCEIQLGCSVFEEHYYTDDRILVPIDEWLLKDNSVTPLLDMPYSFPAGSVVGLMVTSDKSATVSASFRGCFESIEE